MKRINALVALALGLLFSFVANASLLDIMTKGSTSRSVVLRVIDSTTGVPNTGLAFNSSGIDLQYCREATACTAITEATQTAGGAWSSGGFVHMGFGNYRLDVPDAAFATGVNHVEIVGTITGYIVVGGTVRLTDSSLEAANVTANVIQWTGTNVATPDTAGYVKATIKDGTGTGEIDTNAGAVVAVTGVTNLTNAPTAGDLTATMKTSVTTAATASTPTAAAVTGAVGSVLGAVGSVTGAVGSIAAAGITNASFDTTAGPMYGLQIVDQGTAQAATGTTLQIRSAATFADSELVGATVVIVGGSAGIGQARTVSANVSATDTLTVPTWTTTPSGTIKYAIFAAPPGAGGSVTIGAGGISASSFAAGAIDAASIASNAITAAKIASNAITSTQIANDALTNAKFDSTPGSLPALGIIDQGTAQAATSTTLQLRSAASFADDELLGSTCLVTGGSTGVGQSRTVTDYVSSTDTVTVDAWTTTPTGTITYKCFGTAPGAAGTTLTQADIRAAIGLASANIDTQFAGVQADTNDLQTRVPATLVSGRMDSSTGAMAANVLTATAVNADAITAAKVASDVGLELAASLQTQALSTGTAGSVGERLGRIPNVAAAANGGLPTVNASNQIAGIAGTATTLDAVVTAIPTNLLALERVLTGTCSSGSTTTCVDAALTQAATSQIDDHLVCFDDSWCALITDFTPASDTVTTTKVAPSTRASKAYTIFPATAQ